MKANYELRAGTQGHGTMNYDPDGVSEVTGLHFDLEEEPSFTQQQFKEETDINEIVRRFGLTGQLPENYKAPVSGDFTNISSFEEAMTAVAQAQQQFMELPANLRERFNNDPQRLMTFLDDDTNRDEATKLGLVVKPPEKTRDMIQAVDDLAKVLTTPKTT